MSTTESGIAYAQGFLRRAIRSCGIDASGFEIFWIPGEDLRMRTRLRLKYRGREEFAYFERKWLEDPTHFHPRILHTVRNCLQTVLFEGGMTRANKSLDLKNAADFTHYPRLSNSINQ